VDLAPLDPDANPVADARAIVAALRKYDPALAEKPRWLVMNKLDLVPESEREARCKAFVRAMRWKGPVFATSAIDGGGCRTLVHAVQAWLDAHPAPAQEAPTLDAEAPIVVTPAPVTTRRRRRAEP
jgi:GTP-binding protein